MSEPVPLELDIFLRGSSRYFLTATNLGQTKDDLYALAMTRGAFRESELG